MKRLKIALLGTLPQDLERATGGVEAVSVNLISGFAEAGEAEIHWISFTPGITDYYSVQYSKDVTLHYIPVKFRKLQLLDFFLNRKQLNAILGKPGPDVLHVQGAAPHLLRVTGFPKSKIVVTQHGIMQMEKKLVTGWKNKLKFLFKDFIERYYFPTFRHFIFISAYNKALFRKSVPYHSELIRNPVNPLFFAAREELHAPLRLIYVGWISKLKNLGLLLEALTDLREKGIRPQLFVAGGFKEQEYRTFIERFVDEKELSEQVHFAGMLSQKEVFAALKASDVLVVPSLQENLPVSIAEAMSMGKVVVASNVGAIHEMLEHSTSGLLFESGNKKQLSDLLLKLYAGQIDAAAMAENAGLYAREHYSPLAIARQTLSFYHKMNADGNT